MPKVIPLLILLILVACSGGGSSNQNADKSGANYSGDSNPSSGEAPLEPVAGKILRAHRFELRSTDIIQDAFDHTMGSMDVTPVQSGVFTVKGRYVFGSKLSTLPTATRKTLSELCQSNGLFSDTSGLRVWWRSHYSQARRLALASAVAAGHRDIQCILYIENQDGSPFYFSFDPLPLSETDILGSAYGKRAVQDSLMMLSIQSDLVFTSTSLIAAPTAAISFETVKALAAHAHTPSYSSEEGASCSYALNSQTAVSNPTLVKDFKVSLDDVHIKEIRPITVAGKILRACADVKVTAARDQLGFSFTCGTYQATKNEGLEGGCQWALVLQNPSDSEDEATVTVAMPKLAYLGSMSRNWMSGKDTVAKSEMNPVRAKSVQLNGFTATQLAFLEKAFDVILEIAPDIFRLDFSGYMKTASLGTTGSCSTPGVMGFAAVGGTSITLCQYMFGAGIDSPSAVVGAAHTIIHEVRHARGYYHDVDRPGYEPCQGTAYSNVFDHNIVALCKTAYCPLLKSSAEGSYLNDINYSLKGDNRRFLGICKKWQSSMGFTDDRVRAGR